MSLISSLLPREVSFKYELKLSNSMIWVAIFSLAFFVFHHPDFLSIRTTQLDSAHHPSLEYIYTTQILYFLL